MTTTTSSDGFASDRWPLSPFLVGGALLSRRRAPRLAGGLLLLSGVGYLGIVWERCFGARIHRNPDLRELDLSQLLVHLAIIAWGWRLMGRESP